MSEIITRRNFIKASSLGAAALTLSPQTLFANPDKKQKKPLIQGFEDEGKLLDVHSGWVPVSDRKIKVGLIGYGLCQFSAIFSFQGHPNVDVVAVSDLIPERCEKLAKTAPGSKMYPSLEELVKDPEVEAVFICTDAPNHFKHTMLALEHGKHVACAVPAVYGNLDDAYKLMEKVKETGLTYMMFETSAYHEDVYAMRELYRHDVFGKIVYAEGEYYHYMPQPLESFKGWRIGLPPMWYPTHATGYYVCVTGQPFTEVSCQGTKSIHAHLQSDGNVYMNPFGTEIALFRTQDGGSARIAVSWDTPGVYGEMGRIRGHKGTYYNDEFKTDTPYSSDISAYRIQKPPIPPKVEPGGHGGSHGYLTDEFINSILQERKPLVDVAMSLNLTVPGIVAHMSALRDGELLKIPQFTF